MSLTSGITEILKILGLLTQKAPLKSKGVIVNAVYNGRCVMGPQKEQQRNVDERK